MIKLSKIKPNPNNPRIIKDDKFKKLVQSLKDFPKMMELRPIIIDSWENPIPLGGNMRLRALKELGYKEIPDEWIKEAKDLSEEEKKRFVIEDNVAFGEWDFDMLANEWEPDELNEWGLYVPDFANDDIKPKEVELIPYTKTHILLSFPPEKMIDIQPFIQQICAFSFVEYEQSNN